MDSGYTIVVSNPELLGSLCGPNDGNLDIIETYLGAPVVSQGNELTLLSSDDEVCRKFQLLVDKIVSFSIGAEGSRISRFAGSAYVSALHGDSGFSALPSASDGRDDMPVFHFVPGASADGGQFFGRAPSACKAGNLLPLDAAVLTEFIRAVENERMPSFPMNACIDIPHAHKKVFPRTLRQAEFLAKVKDSDIVFCEGPAGTGKTFLVLAEALFLLLTKRVQKIVLTRPVVEAGESLGFLPGDLEQKLNPYLRPLYDAMEKLLPREVVRKLMDSDAVEVAPLAYMRGRSIDNAAVVLDEGQNTTKGQMKMFLTRLGENSKAFITGDLSQIDLPRPELSGLSYALKVLRNIEEIAIISFGYADVVRIPIVKKIIQAYEQEKN